MRKILLPGILVFTLAACNRAPEPKAETPPEARTYTSVGVLQTFLPDGVHVRVNHEAIPGLMDAMTMSFAVADTSLLHGLAEGDSIRFTLTVTGDDIEITGLEKIGRPE
ncbi:copper-binding protein [Rhodocaloribacter sp.]